MGLVSYNYGAIILQPWYLLSRTISALQLLSTMGLVFTIYIYYNNISQKNISYNNISHKNISYNNISYNYGGIFLQLCVQYHSTMGLVSYNYLASIIQLWCQYLTTTGILSYNYGVSILQLWCQYLATSKKPKLQDIP